MGLEVTTTIAGLNELFPTGSDDVADIAKHIQLIKDVIKKQFTGEAGDGLASEILATAQELSYLKNLTSNLQTQLAGLNNKGVLIDGVIMYKGLYSKIPSNYFICDGLNGTEDLRNKFVYGTPLEAEIGDQGGEDDSLNITHDHTYDHGHTASDTALAGRHSHPLNYQAFTGGTNPRGVLLFGDFAGGSVVNSVIAVGDHTHAVTLDNNTDSTASTGVDGAGLNKPRYYRLAYIQRKE